MTKHSEDVTLGVKTGEIDHDSNKRRNQWKHSKEVIWYPAVVGNPKESKLPSTPAHSWVIADSEGHWISLTGQAARGTGAQVHFMIMHLTLFKFKCFNLFINNSEQCEIHAWNISLFGLPSLTSCTRSRFFYTFGWLLEQTSRLIISVGRLLSWMNIGNTNVCKSHFCIKLHRAPNVWHTILFRFSRCRCDRTKYSQ
jgi:hypothetical protein